MKFLEPTPSLAHYTRFFFCFGRRTSFWLGFAISDSLIFPALVIEDLTLFKRRFASSQRRQSLLKLDKCESSCLKGEIDVCVYVARNSAIAVF